MARRVVNLEEQLMLLELEPPFDKRAVQLARRRLAKRWHPDLAPPGKRHAHELHLKAINEAADYLEELAQSLRAGKVTASAVRASAQAARRARAEEGRRAYEAKRRAEAAQAEREKHDPFYSRVPDHSVVHRYARCLSYPEWGVGTVTGIYFTEAGERVQQWARVRFHHGVRTVPADSMRFVDFAKPDPAAERAQRFVVAAKRAMAEGDYALAGKRLIYARDAEPRNVAILRLMTIAFWRAGQLEAAARAARDWARVDRASEGARRFSARIYRRMGAADLAAQVLRVG